MKNLNLSFFNNLSNEDRILLNHIGDFVNLATEKYITKFSFFLNQKQCALCEKLLKSLKFDNFKLYGGYDDAERKILCVFSDYDHITYDDFPIKSLVFRYSNNVGLTHRDILGSLMSLNISRETIGDIIVSDDRAVVFVYDTISDLIKNDITKIGRTGVAVSEESIDLKKEQSFEVIEGTVASFRLDCIFALALKTSREKARTIISSKEVNINYFPVNKPDYLLKENDVFSIRGFGKFRFESINGSTKKNRIHITLKKYI